MGVWQVITRSSCHGLVSALILFTRVTVPLRDTWPCLQTSLVVTTGEVGVTGV